MLPEFANVIWDSPSENALGSMPLGNGDITLNAWAEKNGDLIFYIGKSDSWDENHRLLKLGRIRIRLTPNPFVTGGVFRQELNLPAGEIAIIARLPDRSDAAASIRLWVDANHPAAYVTVESPTPIAAVAHVELWRTERQQLPSLETSDLYFTWDKPDKIQAPVFVDPDASLSGLDNEIGWYHRNVRSAGPEMIMRHQDLQDFPWQEPLLHRTFGVLLRAAGGIRRDDLSLESPSAFTHCFSAYALTLHPATAETWRREIQILADKVEAQAFAIRRERHLAWWAQFWNRSWIHIDDASDVRTPAANAEPATASGVEVAQAYARQRFITACAARGAHPIKFNGSLFTMPFPDKPGDADYRRWGPGYWWQNTRLPYASLCTSGDYDLFRPFFDMYAHDLLEICRYRTRRYLGIDGAYFPECVYPWGAVFMEAYGWDTPAAAREDMLQVSGWHKWEWVCGLELVFMLQDWYEHTQEDSFLWDSLLPAARAVLTFFENYYSTDADGKLVMHPAQALETWWTCTDPMPEVAGLHAVTARLLELPTDALTDADRAWIRSLRDKLPPLPVRDEEGVRMLAPAGKFDKKKNCENPELYAVFPFRLCSFEKPNAKLGREALRHRLNRGCFGWRQDDVFMAYLGLAGEAKQAVAERAANHDPACRFPAFWGPNYDWTPDQDHGAILMKTVQAMLMQCEGKKIYLLPAWPKEWNVEFKLHAPYATIVEGQVVRGNIQALRVTPEARRADIHVLTH